MQKQTSRSSLFAPAARKAKPQYLDFGGNGDCGFLAITAGLLDLYFSQKLQMLINDNHYHAIDDLLSIHRRYFPEQFPAELKAGAHGETSLQTLLDRVDRYTLIKTLAFSLRQLAVQTVNSQPEEFRGAFIHSDSTQHQDQTTHPRIMAKATTEIDETYTAAIAKALQIRIEVNSTSLDRVEASLSYGGSRAADFNDLSIKIRHHDEHYTAAIVNTQEFKGHNKAKSIPEIPQASNEDHLSIEEVIKRCKASDARDQRVYDQQVRRLNQALDAGEVTINDLITEYIKQVRLGNDYLNGRMKYIDQNLKSDNCQFSSFVMSQKSNKPFFQANKLGDKPDVATQSQLRQELVHALSRSVAVGLSAEMQLEHYAKNDKLETQGLPTHSMTVSIPAA